MQPLGHAAAVPGSLQLSFRAVRSRDSIMQRRGPSLKLRRPTHNAGRLSASVWRSGFIVARRRAPSGATSPCVRWLRAAVGPLGLAAIQHPLPDPSAVQLGAGPHVLGEASAQAGDRGFWPLLAAQGGREVGTRAPGSCSRRHSPAAPCPRVGWVSLWAQRTVPGAGVVAACSGPSARTSVTAVPLLPARSIWAPRSTPQWRLLCVLPWARAAARAPGRALPAVLARAAGTAVPCAELRGPPLCALRWSAVSGPAARCASLLWPSAAASVVRAGSPGCPSGPSPAVAPLPRRRSRVPHSPGRRSRSGGPECGACRPWCAPGGAFQAGEGR